MSKHLSQRQRLLPLCLFALLLCVPLPSHSTVSATAPVTLLRNQEYAEALLQGIRMARSSILFSFYLFKTAETDDNIPRKVAAELLKARKRGVEVTVYLERTKGGKDPLDGDNRRTAELLHRGGVKVVFDSELTTTHTKAVVIDGRFVYIGSHNLSQGALSRNNELSVLLDSPELAAEVKKYLDRL